MRLSRTDAILDLGCGTGAKSVLPYTRSNPIVGLDRLSTNHIRYRPENFSYVRGDARDLSAFDDHTFPVVMSFGLLEHLSDADAGQVLAEARRVGQRYVHVVPHRFGMIEPHVRLPLFALWPRVLQDFSRQARGSGSRRRSGTWRAIRWRSRSELAQLLGDPTGRLLACWYGPILMYQVVAGGEDHLHEGSGRPDTRKGPSVVARAGPVCITSWP